MFLIKMTESIKRSISETKRTRRVRIFVLSLIGGVFLFALPTSWAAPPPVSDVMSDDFESGTLDAWKKTSPEDLSLAPGGGLNGTTAAAVAIDSGSSYLFKTDLAQAQEAYFTFWFNPNNVNIPDPQGVGITSKSFRIACIRGPDQWHRLVGLRIRRPTGQGYKAFLEWNSEDGTRYDYLSGEFSLSSGWQKITLGYRVDEWVAVWVNDTLMRQIVSVTHDEPYGSIVEFGKTDSTSSIQPSGSLRFDEVAFQIPSLDHLWVDAVQGNDANNGQSAGAAFATLQKAASLAGPGTTVHILPGVYREAITPAGSGNATDGLLFVAENGPGTVTVRGSEPAADLSWTQLTANTIGLPTGVDPTQIYYADLSAWGLETAPRFVVQLDAAGDVTARLPVAREPDWPVKVEWKYHEYWWAADGGSGVAGCDPATDPDPDCDVAWRSLTQLTDRSNDSEPVDIESGNLTTLGNLTGATLVAADTRHAHYIYRRTIVAHNVSGGTVTVDPMAEMDRGTLEPGLGWGSKYYVENHPILLDTPGEWWFDVSTGRIYLWPPTPDNPATLNIEISRRDTAFDLQNRSYITLDGLNIEFFNGVAYSIDNATYHKAHGNTVRNVTISYVNEGIVLSQTTSQDTPAENAIDGFALEDSEIAYADTYALLLSSWWEDDADPAMFDHPGILNTVIRNNELHHLGFRSDKDSPIGSAIWFPDRLRFEGNHVHHVAHNGLVLHRSIIQATNPSQVYGFTPDEIKTGEILIKDNIFEHTCQIGADCGGLKLAGADRPDNHVFRDALIVGNTSRDIFGWSYAAEKRGDVSANGMEGHGFYFDRCSGLHVYRNIAYNTAGSSFKMTGLWRDGDMVLYNNIAANAVYGFHFSDQAEDDHGGSVNTRLVNNIMVNNPGFGMLMTSADGDYGNLTIDNNLYYSNGWDDEAVWDPGNVALYEGAGDKVTFHNLAEIRANTTWEDHGVEGDPHFWAFDPADHDPFDGSWPDFHPTPASTFIIDTGTTALPASLETLLVTFDVLDDWWGTAVDIGRYEEGFIVVPLYPIRTASAGETVHYPLQLFPSDLPYSVTLSVTSPASDLLVSLSPTIINGEMLATLTVANTHTEAEAEPGLWFSIPISSAGGGFDQTTVVTLLVGGSRVFLPLVISLAP